MAKKWRDMNERERMTRRLGSMKTERSPFDPVYQALSQQLAPANGRFFNDRNRGFRDYSHIVDATGIEAVETSVAGIMSIASSPAQKWAGHTSGDPELDKYHTAKEWLADSRDVVLDILDNSNTYTVLPHYYRELLTFATGAGLVLPNFRNVIHHYPMTCGEYYLQQNDELEVNTFAREFHMTVAQMARRFGLANLSKMVRAQWDNGDLDMCHHIAQLIEPREDRDSTKMDRANMPWRSVYWEVGNDSDGVLDDTGFHRFPVVAPRWDTVGSDGYGTGPGNRTLKHCERLQIMTKRMARGIHQQMDPATVWPASMKNREVDTNPGGRTFGDIGNQQGGARALHDFRPQLDHMLLHLQDIRRQVQDGFFANFFTKISSDPRNDRATAAEIMAIKDETWLMLGPFAQRVFRELLGPIWHHTFHEALKHGALPPIPPELQGRTIGVKFTSVLAQAQESVGAQTDERFIFQLGQVHALKPGVLDKFDELTWADRYAQKLGVDPQLIVPNERVALIQKARDAALLAKEQVAMMESQSKAVKNLGTTPSGGATALSDVNRELAGAGT